MVGEGRPLDQAPVAGVVIRPTAGALTQIPNPRRKVSLCDPRPTPALALVDRGLTWTAHSAICGALLVPMLQANPQETRTGHAVQSRIGRVMAQIAEELGSIAAFQNWGSAHGLPDLHAVGIREYMYPVLVKEAMLSSSYKSNPVFLQPQTLWQVLAEG